MLPKTMYNLLYIVFDATLYVTERHGCRLVYCSLRMQYVEERTQSDAVAWINKFADT